MAKQVIAAIRIKHNGKYYEADKPVDPSEFTKEDLTRLYERGAIKIVNPSEMETKPGTVEDVDAGTALATSVPSMEDEQKAETKRAEAKDQLREQERAKDPNADKK